MRVREPAEPHRRPDRPAGKPPSRANHPAVQTTPPCKPPRRANHPAVRPWVRVPRSGPVRRDVGVSMSGSPIAVASAGTDRLGPSAPVFGRAFVDDQMMRWPMGTWGDPEDQITRCFSFFLEMALGSGVVWEAGAACGAAVWIPPGRFESWVDHPWNQPRIHGLTDDAGVRYEGFWRWIDDHSPEEPLWQLDSIAVEPVQQGRGYGRALIVHGLEQARADGTVRSCRPPPSGTCRATGAAASGSSRISPHRAGPRGSGSCAGTPEGRVRWADTVGAGRANHGGHHSAIRSGHVSSEFCPSPSNRIGELHVIPS